MPFCFFGNKKRSVTTSFGCWWSIRARGETNNSPVGCYRRVGQQRLPGARGRKPGANPRPTDNETKGRRCTCTYR